MALYYRLCACGYFEPQASPDSFRGMEPEETRALLREIFPELEDAVIEEYADSGRPIGHMVNDVLEKRPPIQVSLSECLLNLGRPSSSRQNQKAPPKELNFPEIFECRAVDTKVDTSALRREAASLYKRAQVCRNRITRGTADYYAMEADNCVEEAKRINRYASLVILQKMLNENKPGTIDLHNLFVSEGIAFLEDYLRVAHPPFTVVTGRVGNSRRMQPAAKRYLESKGLSVVEDGPCLLVRRKRP